MGGWLKNGVFLAALSSLLFSLCSLVAKSLVSLHPLQLSSFSFIGLALVSGVAALHRREQLFPDRCLLLLVGRSVAGSLFLVTSFYSVQLIPLGDASVLFYTAPAFTVVLGKWLINEPCTLKNTTITFLLLACVVLVMKPPFVFGSIEMNKNYVIGVAMAITASLSDSLGNIALRDMKHIHFSVVLFSCSFISFIITSVFSVFFSNWVLVNSKDLMLVVILVILNLGEQILITLALKVEPAAIVALVQASDIIYGYAFQVIFFKEVVEFWSVIGAIIIASFVLLLSMDAQKRQKNALVLHY